MFYYELKIRFPSGSGLSSTKGIPGLGGLSIELQYEIPSHLSDLSDTDIWKKNNSVIGMGLEQALHNTRLSPCIENIIGVVNSLIHAKKQIIVKWCIHCKTPKFGYIATATLPICIETL